MVTRYLSLSLLAAVLLSLIGVGSFINMLYGYLSPAVDNDTQFVTDLIQGYQQRLDAGQIELEHLPPLLEPALIDERELPLPQELLAGFHAGEPLTLASEKGVFTYLYLPQRQQVLSVVSPALSQSESWLHLAFTLLFYLIVALAILLWLLPLIRSLNRLQAVAKVIGQGDFKARVEQRSLSPIADIETAFNDMAAKIERLLEDNRLLGRAVSHELKNPLARLRLGIDVVADTAPDSSQHYFERIDRDLDEMQALIDALLKYSRLESASVQVHWQDVDLLALCEQQVAAFSGYRVTFRLPTLSEVPMVKSDPAHLTMVISNLVANAVHYGDGQVAIDIVSDDAGVVVCVEDNGPGIPVNERNRVFIPFERLAGNKRPSGHGIGLAAVQRLCQLLDISIQVFDSASLGGAKFRLTIPYKS